jgi:hypothetical protein
MNFGVVGYKREALSDRLDNQRPIEGIAMVHGQILQSHRVVDPQWKLGYSGGSQRPREQEF